MIRVKVRAFSHLKSLFGFSERVLELKEGTTLESVIRGVAAPHLAGGEEFPFLVSLNLEYQEGMNAALKDGDEIALIPPVSGG